MARYKYSENPNKVTDIYFDTETHGEFMGMEQDGVMKAVPLPMLQEKIVEEVSGDLSAHVADTANPHSVTKTQVGLSNVDNTSDVNKPISTLQQEALDMKESVANVDILKGTGWAGETVKGNADAIETLNADDTTEGSVAKSIKDAVDPIIEDVSDHENRLYALETGGATEGIVLKTIKDNAEDATYDNTDSGLTASTIKTAIDEVEGRVDTAEGEIDELQTAETAIKGNGWTDENLVDHESRITQNESDIVAVKGTGWTDENLVDHENRLYALETGGATEDLVAEAIKDAVDPVKGTGWTDENLVDHESRIGDLETNDTLQDATLGALKETVLTTKLAVNELERQAQIGNGATLDFSDIGIVLLDARATGRANPTIDGLTATNLSEKGQTFQTLAYTNVIGSFNFINGHIYYIHTHFKVLKGTSTTHDLGKIGIISPFSFHFNSGDSSTEKDIDSRGVFTQATGSYNLTVFGPNMNTGAGQIAKWDDFTFIDLTSIFGAGNEPDLETCQKLFSNYFDGTKSIQLPARLRSVSEDELESSTLYIADNEEVRSFGATTDLVKVINGEFVLEKNVNDDATAVISPPITTPLLTSGILKAFQNGTVYYEPYYEGSHQTDASSQITLPYEGTIDKLTGYDENLEPYEVPSTAYTFVGTLLTITGAVENEVFYVELSRSEPLTPEMSVNTLNNDRVLLNPTNGKFYDYTIGVSGADGALIPEFIFTEVE